MIDAARAMFNASVVGEGQSGPFSTQSGYMMNITSSFVPKWNPSEYEKRHFAERARGHDRTT